jgi:xylulokinase
VTDLVVGLDIGTSSTKALAASPDGTIVATRVTAHAIEHPRPGWFEQDAARHWRDEPLRLLAELLADDAVEAADVRAIAVSGMGPCVVPADGNGVPLRPGILYGIDTRASAEIAALERQFGADAILARGGSVLSSQALGPKLLWLRTHEPDVWADLRRWFGPASLLVHALTGEYVLDHHTASQCDPLYDLANEAWSADWIDAALGPLEMPRLVWSTEPVGQVTAAAAAQTGLPTGIPVLGGTVDAWAEAHSVGVRRPGDLMLMYGSTMFLVGVVAAARPDPAQWSAVGLARGTHTLAAGMATSGLLTAWVAELTGRSLAELTQGAAALPPGADGLVLLPYFAGERSPLFDPGARGAVLGLELRHRPEHLMRAAYEAVAMGVRHILEHFDTSSTDGERRDARWRIVASGGGAAVPAWTQIVSDVTQLRQLVPATTVGAAYGDALLAATAAGLTAPDADWTRDATVVEPRPEAAAAYDRLYGVYRDAYTATRPLMDRLVT